MSGAERAVLIAALLAVDPAALGGVCLRSYAQPLRDQWIRIFRDGLPMDTPVRRIPHNISDRQLFGGLDLSVTLKLGRPVAELGQLSAAHGGILMLAMAERLSERTASCIGAALDRGAVSVPREGVMLSSRTEFGVVALDEGLDGEAAPGTLLERLAFFLDLNALAPRTELRPLYDREQITEARGRLRSIRLPSPAARTLVGACQALGADSDRAPLLAARAARACAALAGRSRITDEDLVTATELVIAHRATRFPAPEPADLEPPPPEGARPPQDSAEPSSATDDSSADRNPLEERVIAAAKAAIPPDLLAQLEAGQSRSRSTRQAGQSGALRYSLRRGRPVGVRAGDPQVDGRLSIIDTLQAAAPWQRLRARGRQEGRISVEYADFRVTRYRQRARTLIVFAVDASGSAALHRLAEAKGAVELILADCYVRRDQVAVVGFRGQTAEVLLPPTRSLVRAKKSLAGLPGGGGTPLACGIVAALDMALKAQRRGDTASILLLTDGRANVGVKGAPGRESAHQDALRAAAAVRHAQVRSLFIDTSPRPSRLAREIAQVMSARYVPLPSSDSRRILDLVKS